MLRVVTWMLAARYARLGTQYQEAFGLLWLVCHIRYIMRMNRSVMCWRVEAGSFALAMGVRRLDWIAKNSG